MEMTERGALSHKEAVISTAQVDLNFFVVVFCFKIQQNLKLKKKKVEKQVLNGL